MEYTHMHFDELQAELEKYQNEKLALEKRMTILTDAREIKNASKEMECIECEIEVINDVISTWI